MSNADQLKEKGVQLFQSSDFEQAVKVFEEAKDAYQANGNDILMAEMMVNIGLVRRSLGEGQQAIESIQNALRVFQREGDTLRTAQALGNLGGVYAKLDDTEQAYNTYRQAADIFEEIGEKEMYGQILLAMGKLQINEGKFLAGAATYQVALENVSNPTWQERIIKRLGNTLNGILGTPPPTSDTDDNKNSNA